LHTKKFYDGSPIPTLTDSLIDSSEKYYAVKMNEKDNESVYYNWHAIQTGKLCPVGWHVPTDEEWDIMIQHLGGVDIAGGKLKECGTHNWHEPNVDATNVCNFSAKATGFFGEKLAQSIKTGCIWWTASPYENNPSFAWTRCIYNSESVIYRASAPKKLGFAVRCMKNNDN